MVIKEATRFAKSLPENYDLKAKAAMRILCLKFKEDPQPLQFTINKQGQLISLHINKFLQISG